MSTDGEIIVDSVDSPRLFAEIFDRYAKAIGDYARRRVGREAADDVLSETFLVAFKRRASFDGRWDTARPWLLGIATHVIKRHRATEAAQWRAFERAAGAGERFSGSHAGEADERIDASAAVRALGPRIAALSAKDRDTLLLYAWGDLTYEQVAEALGVPVGTVRSRLNRVRRKLAPPGSHGAARLTWIAKEESDAAYGTSA